MSNFTAKQLHYEVTSLRLRRNFTRDLRSRWWAQVESSHAPHSRLKRSAVFHARLFCFSPTAAGAALVGSSGVEPPTSRLSGARSNLLSYEPVFPSAVLRDKSSLLSSLLSLLSHSVRLVEMMGFEPMTPCLQGRCSPN